MSRIKFKKERKKNKVLWVVLFLIFLITSLFLNTIGRKTSDNMINIGNYIINDTILNVVNSNIKIEFFKKYGINDLININYQNGNISSIDYDLEKAYELIIEIKESINSSIEDYDHLMYYYDFELENNRVIVEMPFYSSTSNLLLANLGPKIYAQINMIQNINGSIYTKIKTYGINSLLIELYINFTVVSSIVVPFSKEVIENSYDVLIASKVIQGNIPSLYNGLFESNSPLISY